MRFFKACRRIASALLMPQACVLCEDWVLQDDLSPLCSRCLQGLPRFDGPLCSQCGSPLPGDVLHRGPGCAACILQPPQFDAARAWGPYRGDLRKLLHAFKFQGLHRLARPLARMLADCPCWSPAQRPDYLLAVPSHRRRVRQRGFNPPALLARFLARRLAIPLFADAFRRRHTLPQTGLSANDRRRNLSGAFGVSRAELLEGKRIVLLDDVLTTATTANELARTLREAAMPQWIGVLTVARAIRWTQGAAWQRKAIEKA